MSDADQLLDAVTEIQNEAKKTFSLSDRLKGIKTRKKKIVVFLDDEAVDAYEQHRISQQQLADAAARATDLDFKDKLLAQYNMGEELEEGLKQAMLEGALSIHLRAVPNVVIKSARREANRRYVDETGQIPFESRHDFTNTMTCLVLKDAVEKIVDAQGAESRITSLEEALELSNALPPTQWERLDQMLNVLAFQDSIGSAATDDPGF